MSCFSQVGGVRLSVLRYLRLIYTTNITHTHTRGTHDRANCIGIRNANCALRSSLAAWADDLFVYGVFLCTHTRESRRTVTQLALVVFLCCVPCVVCSVVRQLMGDHATTVTDDGHASSPARDAGMSAAPVTHSRRAAAWHIKVPSRSRMHACVVCVCKNRL